MRSSTEKTSGTNAERYTKRNREGERNARADLHIKTDYRQSRKYWNDNSDTIHWKSVLYIRVDNEKSDMFNSDLK